EVTRVSLQGLDLLARHGVPDLRGVVRATRGNTAAVRAERHARNRALVAFEKAGLRNGRGIPHFDRLVPTRAGQAFAVGAEGQPADPFGVALEGEVGLPGARHVPDLDGVVATARGELGAVRAEHDAED